MAITRHWECDGCGKSITERKGYLPPGWQQPVIKEGNARKPYEVDTFDPDLCPECATKLFNAAKTFVAGLRSEIILRDLPPVPSSPIAVPATERGRRGGY